MSLSRCEKVYVKPPTQVQCSIFSSLLLKATAQLESLDSRRSDHPRQLALSPPRSQYLSVWRGGWKHLQLKTDGTSKKREALYTVDSEDDGPPLLFDYTASIATSTGKKSNTVLFSDIRSGADREFPRNLLSLKSWMHPFPSAPFRLASERKQNEATTQSNCKSGSIFPSRLFTAYIVIIPLILAKKKKKKFKFKFLSPLLLLLLSYHHKV